LGEGVSRGCVVRSWLQKSSEEDGREVLNTMNNYAITPKVPLFRVSLRNFKVFRIQTAYLSGSGVQSLLDVC
jgi:hypothetical protein